MNIPIRLKILVIVLGFFVLVAAAFALYSADTTGNYKQLRLAEVEGAVAFESERVGKVITEMERNAVDLALAGYQFCLAGNTEEALGASISVENFSAFPAAVGGGIWFEPYALEPETRRVCYYAFFDPAQSSVRLDPEFVSEEYDYLTQSWYTQIKARLRGRYQTVWTAPYYEDIGTNSLMTTVGAGIYDEQGQFIGMSTVDWQIQSVVDRLSAIRPTENSFVLLASPQDDYILSNTFEPGLTRTGSSLRALPWYHYLNFAGGDEVETGNFSEQGVDYLSFSRLLENGWLFSVQIPQREIFAEIAARNTRFTVLLVASALLLLGLAYLLLSRLINRPLRALTEGVARLGGGNLDGQIALSSRDELGTLAKAFNKMTVDLKTSLEQTARERAEKERIGAELHIARTIQASMLPCVFPPFPHRKEFDIYATMLPAKEVGGDFYDFFLIDPDNLAVVIADVSGKGVPAALFMVIAKTLIKNNAQSGKGPAQILTAVNNLLCENNEAGMFVTAFLGVLHIPTGLFTYANAGHNPPLLRCGNGAFDRLPVSPGFVLAGMGDVSYTQREIMLDPGDALYLYTDGVTEAEDRAGALFSEAGLLAVACRCAHMAPEPFLLSIKQEIDLFAAGMEQADDITMLVLQYFGGALI